MVILLKNSAISYQKIKDLTETLYLSNMILRTTEKRHKFIEELWNKSKIRDIYLSKYSGWYSVSDEAYYDERGN